MRRLVLLESPKVNDLRLCLVPRPTAVACLADDDDEDDENDDDDEDDAGLADEGVAGSS